MKAPILKVVFLAAFSCAVCMFMTGCVWFAPLPTKHEPISSRSAADFEFISGHPTRSEVEAKLGRPDLFNSDLHVAIYTVEKLDRRKVKLLFFLIPVGWFTDYPGYQIACIEFDAQGRARRFGFTTIYSGFNGPDLRYEAEDWIKTRDGKKPERGGS